MSAPDPNANLYTIEVDKSWLEQLAKAVIPLPDGTFARLGWIEPLVDSGRIRLMFIPAECEVIVPNMIGSNIFSRN